MKFEHNHQKVASTRIFLLRVGRYALFSVMLIIISLMIGLVGYHESGSLSWLDSFYMSSMILTGMGPVVEIKTASAKVFSSFYALYSGVAFLTITAVFFAPIIHRLLHILHVEPDEENSSDNKQEK